MKRFLAFFLFLVLTMNVQAEEKIEEQSLHAKAAVLMDAKSGRVLYEKNGEDVMAMASTTKIMTCIIALEESDLKEIVQVSKNASIQPKVHLGMKENEQFYLRDLLYSLMLESHNDSAVAIAEHVAGTTSGFSEMMNEKAKEIGCKNTYFITPNGLDETNETGFHSTTAKDLARIMKYCICESSKKDTFLKITSTPQYTFTNLDKNRNFSCLNRNSFLNMMDGAISGKTGFTGKAGYCYVGALERDGEMYIVTLLACGWPNNKNYKWEDTKYLMEYALKNYSYQTYKKIELPNINVNGGIPNDNNIFSKRSVPVSTEQVELLTRETEKINVITEYKNVIDAPVIEGEKVGAVKYYVDEILVEERPIIVTESVEKKTLQWYWSAFLQLYLL